MNNLFLLPSISGFGKGQFTTTVLLGNEDDLIRDMKRGEVTMIHFMGFFQKLLEMDVQLSLLTKTVCPD